MIVDCFTHTWENASALGRCDGHGGATTPALSHRAAAARHRAASEPVDVTFVLGFKSDYLGAEISNDHVAAYVTSQGNRMIGIAGVDPSDAKGALTELRRARHELSLPGVAVAPAAQDFHPNSSQAMRLYAEAGALDMPVFFHTGPQLASATKMEYAQPVLLDEVARELPDLRIVIAHMGSPWIHETILLLRKHQNVFAEISGLLQQPWRAYEALLSAHQCGVLDKLLFGSGFPDAPASMCIESLYSLNHLVHGTSLPTIPREQLRGIVERDTLELLGIAHDRWQPQRTLMPADEIHDEV
jgi:predicted TIM-barrel fold metal-dependent hydrolase